MNVTLAHSFVGEGMMKEAFVRCPHCGHRVFDLSASTDDITVMACGGCNHTLVLGDDIARLLGIWPATGRMEAQNRAYLH